MPKRYARVRCFLMSCSIGNLPCRVFVCVCVSLCMCGCVCLCVFLCVCVCVGCVCACVCLCVFVCFCACGRLQHHSIDIQPLPGAPGLNAFLDLGGRGCPASPGHRHQGGRWKKDYPLLPVLPRTWHLTGTLVPSRRNGSSPPTGAMFVLLWMDEIRATRHVETMVETIACRCLQQNRLIPGILGCCEMDFGHPQYGCGSENLPQWHLGKCHQTVKPW